MINNGITMCDNDDIILLSFEQFQLIQFPIEQGSTKRIPFIKK